MEENSGWSERVERIRSGRNRNSNHSSKERDKLEFRKHSKNRPAPQTTALYLDIRGTHLTRERVTWLTASYTEKY